MDAEAIVERLRREAALDSTYGRGASLARSGAVASCDVAEGALGSTVILSGAVRGSRGEPYRAMVQLDVREGDVLDYDCTCPAAATYEGMCKHEIALVLAYLDWEGQGPVSARRAEHPRPPAARPPRAVPTSPAIRDLLEDLAGERLREAERAGARAREGLANERAGADEPVELLVDVLAGEISYYQQRPTWCVKLRVRRGRATYVVKNVAAFVDACRCGEVVTYGRSLSFAHVLSAFTERAQSVIGVLSRVVASQQALFRSRWRYQESGHGADVKELPMAEPDLVALLDAMQGATVSFVPNDGPYHSRGRARELGVTEGDPAIEARLSPASDGGYDLSLSGALCCFTGEGEAYVLDERFARRCSPEYGARASVLLPGLLADAGSAGLHLSPDDVPVFCRDLLPILRDVTELAAPPGLEELAPPEAVLTFRVGLEDGLVTCDARVAYGSWEHGLYGPDRLADERARWVPRGPAQPEPVRDLAAECRAMDAVERWFPGGHLEAGDLPCFDEDSDELLFDLLTQGLAELGSLGEVLLSERLRCVEVRDSPRLSVRATVRSGLLDVSLDASGMSPRDIEEYLAAYRRHQRFVRLSGGDIVRLGEGAAAVGELADTLGVSGSELAAGVHGLPTNRVPFVDSLLKRSSGVLLSRNDAFRAIVREFDSFADADYEVPQTLAGVLRPYQRDGFRWLQMLERLGLGGILADDMGLGKTLQVISHLLACRERERAAGEKGDASGEKDAAAAGASGASDAPAATTLVVCPASLVYNWMSELARFAPELDAVAVVGAKAARRRLISKAASHDVLVTSYDLMRRDVDDYASQGFARVVLDEAHYIKNPLTQVSRAARRLPGRTRVALTGTPIENRTAELWSIFDFLMPGVLGSRDAFAKAYEGPVEAGDERATQRLRRLVSPFILRRLKQDVLADLPEKTENVVVARMTGEQERLYRANQDLLARQIAHELPEEFKRKKLQVLAELTRLRQICCDPSLAYDGYEGGSAKLETCLELVAGALEGGHRVLLFSQFTSMLDIISARLAAQGVDHFALTGATSKEERRRMVERFQAGAAPVFLISLRAGGVGLNLTAADVVIHYDPWWNLAAQNQATDRAHRIGQERSVSVFKLICEDTIEERIVAMQESKRELAESLLSGEGVRSAALSRDDLLALLGAAAG